MNSLCHQPADFINECDVYVTPTCPQPALAIGEIDANSSCSSALDWLDHIVNHFAPFTPVFNATEQPAMSAPLYQSVSNLPVSAQLPARDDDEAVLYQLAGQLECAEPWQDRVPSTSIFDGYLQPESITQYPATKTNKNQQLTDFRPPDSPAGVGRPVLPKIQTLLH